MGVSLVYGILSIQLSLFKFGQRVGPEGWGGVTTSRGVRSAWGMLPRTPKPEQSARWVSKPPGHMLIGNNPAPFLRQFLCGKSTQNLGGGWGLGWGNNLAALAPSCVRSIPRPRIELRPCIGNLSHPLKRYRKSLSPSLSESHLTSAGSAALRPTRGALLPPGGRGGAARLPGGLERSRSAGGKAQGHLGERWRPSQRCAPA